MIICVSLNTALDRVYDIPDFAVGKSFRVASVREIAGGKALNVARVARQLGARVRAIGFVGGHTGRRIAELAQAEGLETAFVEVAGESRQCHTFVHAGRDSTQVNEVGPVLSAADVERLRPVLRENVRPGDLVCFSGSVPPGVPKDVYATLIRDVQEVGAVALLDSSGEAFARGLEAVPYAIKPNRPELEEHLGRPVTLDELPEIARAFHDRGIAWVLISLGEDGMIAAAAGAVWRVKVPRIEVVTAVGSGDAFVGGWAATVTRWADLRQPTEAQVAEALRRGAAAGVSNALRTETGHVDPEQVRTLMDQIQVFKV